MLRPGTPVLRPMCEMPMPEMTERRSQMSTTGGRVERWRRRSHGRCRDPYGVEVPDTEASLASTRTMPVVTSRNRFFWTSGERGVLEIQRCDACRRWVHPPVPACPACGGGLTPEPVSGKGTVFSFTVNRHPYHPLVPLPYVIAIVQLAEQDDLRLITNIVGCEPEQVAVDTAVRVEFEQHDDLFIPVFAPDAD
jgi:uncharacterized protein